jgi:hypothetical protein
VWAAGAGGRREVRELAMLSEDRVLMLGEMWKLRGVGCVL